MCRPQIVEMAEEVCILIKGRLTFFLFDALPVAQRVVFLTRTPVAARSVHA